MTLAARNFVMSSATVRAAALREVGGFAREITGTDDYDLWFRLMLAGHTAARAGDTPLLLQRDRDDSQSKDDVMMLRGLLLVLERALADPRTPLAGTSVARAPDPRARGNDCEGAGRRSAGADLGHPPPAGGEAARAAPAGIRLRRDAGRSRRRIPAPRPREPGRWEPSRLNAARRYWLGGSRTEIGGRRRRPAHDLGNGLGRRPAEVDVGAGRAKSPRARSASSAAGTSASPTGGPASFPRTRRRSAGAVEALTEGATLSSPA